MQALRRSPSNCFLCLQRGLLFLVAAVNAWEVHLRIAQRSLFWIPHAAAALAALGLFVATWPRRRG
jgi:hypothetical protein